MEQCLVHNIKTNILVCPMGYLPMDGDVPDDKSLRNYSASLEECTRDCDDRRDCNSFEHSNTSDTGCKLLKEAVPMNPKFEEFQFCRKIRTGTSVHECKISLLLTIYITITASNVPIVTKSFFTL